MTARYRCPFCGSMTSNRAGEVLKHMYDRHRMAMIMGLGLIEAFGTREEAIAP